MTVGSCMQFSTFRVQSRLPGRTVVHDLEHGSDGLTVVGRSPEDLVVRVVAGEGCDCCQDCLPPLLQLIRSRAVVDVTGNGQNKGMTLLLRTCRFEGAPRLGVRGRQVANDSDVQAAGEGGDQVLPGGQEVIDVVVDL